MHKLQLKIIIFLREDDRYHYLTFCWSDKAMKGINVNQDCSFSNGGSLNITSIFYQQSLDQDQDPPAEHAVPWTSRPGQPESVSKK